MTETERLCTANGAECFGNVELLSSGVGRTEISYGTSNEAMLKKMLPFRSRFVKEMNWLPEEIVDKTYFEEVLPWLKDLSADGRQDVDFYDVLDTTLHLALMDRDTDEIIAGLRLTRVPSIEDSLSWGMLKNSDDMKRQAYEKKELDNTLVMDRLNRIAANGNVWDLTRLVNPLDGGTDFAKVVGGMMELFATAYGVMRKNTPPEEWNDIRWVFNGTGMVKAALEHLQIQHDVLAKGQVSKKDVDAYGNVINSYFCVVAPESALRYIQDHAHEQDFVFPYQHTENGLKKANAL